MRRKNKMEYSVTEVKEVPKDLQDKVSSLKALSKIHKLLNEGTYHFGYMKDIEPSLVFLESLHSQVLEDALTHEDIDLVDELKALKKAKEEKDGTAKTESN